MPLQQPPTNKKSLQSFFGEINFMRRFIQKFSEKVKPMNALPNKDATFRWDNNNLKLFKDIKDSIKALVLVSPNYSRDFIIFSFSSQDTIAGVLLQKNKDDYEKPIAFMRKKLRDSMLNYSITKK
jgi:hypothetical protein